MDVVRFQINWHVPFQKLVDHLVNETVSNRSTKPEKFYRKSIEFNSHQTLAQLKWLYRSTICTFGWMRCENRNWINKFRPKDFAYFSFDSWLSEICKTWFLSLSLLNSYSLLIFYEYLSNYTTVKVSNLKPTPLSFHSLLFPNLSLFYKTPKYYHRLILLIHCFCNSKLNTSSAGSIYKATDAVV